MGEQTGIQWCDHTFNPWIGCTKVSPGCDNCYAEALMESRLGFVEWGKGKPRRRTMPANWAKVLTWDRKARAAGVRRRLFCASNADVFDIEVLDTWRSDLWELVRKTTNLDWLFLTKRPHLIAAKTPADILRSTDCWFGTSVESQEWEWRIRVLLEVRCAGIKWLSCEPLLGPLDLTAGLTLGDVLRPGSMGLFGDGTGSDSGIGWVVAGGESGPRARRCDVAWLRSLRDQCAAAGVPFFLKQWGSRPITTWSNGELCDQPLLRDRHGGDESEWPKDLQGLRQFPEAS